VTAAVEAISISKSFGSGGSERVVVNDVSFSVQPGEVLGVVGPNGAGKTTAIRMVLNIIRPDSGTVLLFGEPFAGHHRPMLGYLPEERGLYKDQKVLPTLEYLGTLKGLTKRDARDSAGAMLQRLGMAEHAGAKLSELSKGMSQLIQLAAAIQHQPRLVVLDEPFSGLDPVNVRLVKEILAETRANGAATILSTHQMNQVEEMCDRVMMINFGRVVLEGTLDEVRGNFGEGSVVVEMDGDPAAVPGLDPLVEKVVDHGSYHELALRPGADSNQLLRALAESDETVRRFEVASLPLEEVFVRVVKGSS
jgi:ABC-2 type transport system ATP-binding protein